MASLGGEGLDAPPPLSVDVPASPAIATQHSNGSSYAGSRRTALQEYLTLGPSSSYAGIRHEKRSFTNQSFGPGGYDALDDDPPDPNVYIGQTGRRYEGEAVGLRVYQQPRLAIILLIEWVWFDRFILIAILCNCALLAKQGPRSPAHSGTEQLSLMFQIIFTAEMVLKVIAQGLIFNGTAYMRETWNLLDLTVVITGWLPYIAPGAGNFSAIRCVRALRPLRSIKRMPGVKALVDTMIAAAFGLANVVMLCAFIFLVFGILGMQLFSGTLRFHCFEPGASEPIDVETVCRPDEHNAHGSCPGEQLCLEGHNPDHGAISFDSIASAFMTIFQCITLEGWVDVMYMEMDAVGWGAALYFILLIVVGAFWVLNLFLAVICDKFADPERPEESKDGAEEPLPPSPNPATPHGRRQSWAMAKRRQRSARTLVESKAFQRFIVGVILTNTLLMCCYYYGMPEWFEESLDNANIALSVVFAVEMGLKLYAWGVTKYVSDTFNLFDGLVVFSSFFELIVEYTGLGSSGINVSSLRALRLFRVLKLARALKGLRRVLEMMLHSLLELNSLFVLMSLLMFVFALLGEQLFGLEFTEENGFDEVPRTNFDDLGQALITVFVVMSGENWNSVFIDCYAFAPFASSVYFVVLVVIGNFVIINLIIAILLNSIDHDDDDDEEHDEEFQTALSTLHHDTPVMRERSAGLSASTSAVPILMATDSSQHHKRPGGAKIARQSVKKLARSRTISFGPQPPRDGYPCYPMRQRDHALGLLPPEQPARQAVRELVKRKEFDAAMLVLIVLSSIGLALEPLTPAEHAAASPAFVATLLWGNVVATWIFTAELALKVVAHGLLFPRTAYLRDPWNRLDALIVLTSLVALYGDGASFFKALRMVRMLRPLRLIARHGGMKLIVNALLQTLPHVVSVLVVCTLFLVVFGILGVQLFAGTFHECSDAEVLTEAACVGLFETDDGELVPREWANPEFGSFDSLPSAALLLFEMSGLEGWPDVMYRGIDATSPGHGPVRQHNPIAALFFMAWIVIGAFFILNMFIGVIVDTFNTIKEHESGLLFMTPEQQQWVHAQGLLLKASAISRAPRPLAGWRVPLYDVVTSTVFEVGVMVVIVINTTCMALDSYDKPAWFAETLHALNLAFVIIFTAEAVLKIAAFRFAKYIANPWNRFDLLVVVGGLIDTIFTRFAVALPLSPMLLRVLRLFRVARVLRVIRAGEALRMLLNTLFQSLPSLSNVVILLGLLLFVYAVLGTHLFCLITQGEFLDRHANFGTLPVALLTLFRCATGEDWNGIMHDLMLGGGCADDADPSAGCSTWAAVPYFVSYTLVSTFITLNIVIAIILDNFSDSGVEQDPSTTITDAHIDAFRDAWAEIDPDALQRISLTELPRLVMATPYPLGLRGKQTSTARSDCMKLVKQLDIKVYNPGVTGGPRSRAESGIDWITYYETLDALVRHAFPTVKDSAMHGLEVVSESLTSIEKQLALKKDAELKRSIVQQQQQAGGLMAMRSESSELGLLLPTTPVGELYPVVRLQQQFRASAEKRKERNRRQRRLINDTGAIDPPAEMAPRTGASTVIIKSRLVVFGGLGPGDRLLKDCWELLTGPGTWVDRSASVPPELEPRFGHTAAAFGRNKMVINGGQGTHGRLSDVWEVDLADYSWRQLVADTSTAAQQRAMAGAPQQRAQNGTPAHPQNGEAGARADALGELPLWIQNEIVSPSSADEPAEQAALELQRVWRGRLARDRADHALRLAALEYFAAAVVQAHWRGLLVRRRLGKQRAPASRQSTVRGGRPTGATSTGRRQRYD